MHGTVSWFGAPLQEPEPWAGILLKASSRGILAAICVADLWNGLMLS